MPRPPTPQPASPSTPRSDPSPRRPIRVALAAALLIALAAYATVPSWIPTGWLRLRIERDLSLLLNSPVAIGEVRLDWNNGVTVRDIVVPDARTRGGRILHLRQVRCGLTPLRWLAGAGLDRLELIEPVLTIQFEPDGSVNLVALRPRPGGPATHHWIIRDAQLRLINPADPRGLVLAIGTLALDIDPDTRRTRATVVDGALIRDMHLEHPLGTWAASADLTAVHSAATPNAAPVRRALEGDVVFRWEHVDLAAIPLHWWTGGRLTLAGRTSGQIRGAPGDELQQAFTIDARADALRVHAPGVETANLSHAALHADCLWKPSDEALQVRTFRLDLPGVVVNPPAAPDAPRPAIELAARAPVPLTLHAVADFTDVQAVRAWCPLAVADWLKPLAGAGRVVVRWRNTRAANDLVVSLQSNRLAVDLPGALAIPSGTQLSLDAALTWQNHPPRIQCDGLDLRIAGATLHARGVVPLPAHSDSTLPYSPPLSPLSALRPWLAQPADLLLSFAAADCAPLLALFPALSASLPAGPEPPPLLARGPLAVQVHVQPRAHANLVAANLQFDAAATLRAAPWIDKPPGEPLTLDVQAVVDPTHGLDLDRLQLRLAHGADLLLIDPADSRLRLRDPLQSADTAPSDDAVLLRADLSASLCRLASLQALCPAIDAWRPTLRRDGRLAATLACDLSIRPGPSGRPSLDVDAAELEVDATDLLVEDLPHVAKPPGAPVLLNASYSADPSASDRRHRLWSRACLETATLHATLDSAGDSVALSLVAALDDLSTLLALSPRLADLVQDTEPRGALAAELHWLRARAADELLFDLDATDASFRLPAAPPYVLPTPDADPPPPPPQSGNHPLPAKERGVPLHAFVHARSPRRLPASDPSPRRWFVQTAGLVLADSSLVVDGGHLDLGAFGHAPAIPPSDWIDAVPRADLRGAAQLRFDSTLRRLHPYLAAWLDRFAVSGTLRADWSLHRRNHALDLASRAALDQLASHCPDAWDKPAGRSLAASWSATLENWPAVDASGNGHPPARLHVHDLTLEAPAFRITGRLRDWPLAKAAESLVARPAELTLTLNAADAGELGLYLLPLPVKPRSGVAHCEARLRAASARPELRSLQVAFDHLALSAPTGAAAEETLEVDGAASLTPDHAATDGLSLALRGADLTLVADLRGPAPGEPLSRGLAGSVFAASTHCDFRQVFDAVNHWLLLLRDRIPADRSAPGAPAGLSPALREFIRRCDLSGAVHVTTAHVHSLRGAGPFNAHELLLEPSIRDGRIALPFRCAVNAGVVTGRIDLAADQPNPYFDLRYDARQLASQENTRPLVEAFFPGLTVSGPITLVDSTHQRLFDEPGVANPAVGSGEMILDHGTVVGRAAPLAVTALFPGLNLARFDFSRLVNRFEKRPDGASENHMVLFGNYYDMYIDGTSYPDGRIHYEVGLDLYATLYPALSRQGQGRIPLFIKTGIRRPDNSIADETVSYLRPDQIFARILSDNPLTHAYHTIRTRFERTVPAASDPAPSTPLP